MQFQLRATPVPGVQYDFGGGVSLLVPPLPLGQLQLLQDRLAALTGGGDIGPDKVATVLDVAYAALRRNYPEITREEVGDLVDVANMFDVIAMVMDVSGARRKEADAAKNQQAQPATPLPTGQA